MANLYHIMGLIFVDARTHAHYAPYDQVYLAGLILQLGDHPQKSWKLDPSKFPAIRYL